MKHKLLFGAVLQLFFISNNYAQQTRGGDRPEPVTFSASPNAASLGAYGQVPVNLFNGQPNISVDLYNVYVDNYTLPISLSYNLAAVKPEQHPGWTGLGWNLSAGGSVTRMVNGRVDEVVVSNFTNPNIFSYYDNYSRLSDSNWSSDANMANLLNCMTSFGPTSICAYPAPDEFMFNVNGLSGSFYKNHEGTWVVKANQKIDIKVSDVLRSDFVLNEVGNHPTNTKNFNLKRIIYGFTLTTDDGTQYTFGKNNSSIEFSASPNSVADSYNPNFVAKTWYLTTITLPSSKQITFEYLRDPKATFVQHITSDIMYYNVIGGANQTYSGGFYTSKSLERTYNVYLNKIITDNTQLEFNKSFSYELDYNLANSPWGAYTQEYVKPLGVSYPDYIHWYKLDSFIVKRKSDNIQIKKINFNYLENATSRLFLNNIQEVGLLSTPVEKTHTFEYNQTALPAYNSQKIDHWGYYNNQNFFTSVIPNGTASNGQPIFSQQQLRDIYPNYRNPNSSVMQAGILTKIIYPTKGFSEFYYEPNDFSQVINRNVTDFSLVPATTQNEIGGGLRIKKIISNPNNSGGNLIKEYFYVKDYRNNILSSSGILSGRSVYYENGSTSDFNFWRLKSYSIVPLSNTNGNNVTYSNVVEKRNDGSFTEYNYANHDNEYIDRRGNKYLFATNTSSIPASINHLNFNSLESERGNLLSEKKYNNQQVLVEKTDSFYNNDAGRFSNEIRIIDFYEDVYGTPIPDTPVGTVYSHIKAISKMTAYSIFTHQTYLKRTENTVYDLTNNSSIISTKDYSYTNLTNFHQLRSEITSSSITGETIETKNYYAPDNEMINKPFRSDLIASNKIGIPLKNEVLKNNQKLFEQQVIYAKDATTNNLLLTKNTYSAKFPNILPILPNNIGQLENKITYNQYDDKGNILQYTPEGGLPVSIIWGYNKTQPIAKIENVIYSNIASATINALQNLTNAANASDPAQELVICNNLDALRTSFPDSIITTYTYKLLVGVSTITDPKGNKITYAYDTFGRLQYVTDKDGNTLSANEYHYKN